MKASSINPGFGLYGSPISTQKVEMEALFSREEWDFRQQNMDIHP